MGSNVIFRFSFRSSLFIVYQYYTGCWFYFSYFLLYYFPFGLYLALYCGYTISLLIGFALFLLQVSFCKWWLASHKQGPLESIWHKWTWMFSNNK